jgi:hypothetical protein
MARAAVRPVVPPKLLRLVSWNPQAAAERERELEKAGFKVHAGPAPTKQLATHFRDLAPAAIVIDMDKLPSHGRAVAVVLRTTKSTRHFPLVFAGGEPEKVERARRDMPDACFTDWKRAAPAIKRFIASAPPNPIQPPAYMDQFAGSSTIKKLGFKAGMKIAMIAAPEGFEEQLGELPENVEIGDRLARQTQLALWFVRSRGELESEIDFMSARLPEGCSIWIIHPKQTSRLKADFNQNHVRNVALAAGWVDYKVCAVDADWSGLKFARKKK